MQKIKKTAVLLLLFGVFFSSCEKQHGQDPKRCMNEAELLSQLRAYNDSLMRQEKTITKSPNWRNVAQVAIADITGAKEGAKYGGRLGARIGTLLGSPIYGAATGALVGGVAVGALFSYLAYEDEGMIIYENRPPFDSIYNEILLSTSLVLLERNNDFVIDENTHLIDTTYNIVTDGIIPSDQIDFPAEDEDFVFVGVGHNIALEEVLEPEAAQIDSSFLFILPDLESQILLSQDLRSVMQAIYLGENDGEEVASISDNIIESFIEAYIISSEGDVINIANDYLDIIIESQVLTEEEENAVCAALSVAVNTHFFWSSRLSGGE